MNVFAYLYNFAIKEASRFKFYLFNFFAHLIILGITDNFTTKGILLAYASFAIDIICGEFIFYRLNKVMKSLERLIYANKNLEDLSQEESVEEEQKEESTEEEDSEEEDQQSIRERINF